MSKILRPADLYTLGQELPQRAPEKPPVEVLSEDFIKQYDITPAAVVKFHYENDPDYRRKVDLISERRRVYVDLSRTD